MGQVGRRAAVGGPASCALVALFGTELMPADLVAAGAQPVSGRVLVRALIDSGLRVRKAG